MLEEIKERLQYLDRGKLWQFEKLLEIRHFRIMFAKEHHRNMRLEKMNFVDFPHIRALYEEVSPEIVLQGSVQSLKALALDEKVLTPSGWKDMGDIVVGDVVTSPSEGETKVRAIADQGVVTAYNVVFADGRRVVACKNHLWKVRSTLSGHESVLRTKDISDLMWDYSYAYEVPSYESGWAEIKHIYLSTPQEMRCISVEAEDSLYVTTNGIVTHNSEFAIIDHLASAFCGLNIFYVLPKVESRAKYVQSRVNRVIDCSPFYKSVSDEGAFDSINMKAFGRGIITYVGSNVFGDFVSQPCDKGMVDEVDQCKAEYLPYITDRLEASPFKFKTHISNPTLPNVGINRMFLDSDQKEWHLPCTACGKLVECSWFDTVVEAVKDKQGNILDYRLRDTEWRPGMHRDIHMICPSCQGVVNRASQKGRWVPKQKHYISGYHISGLCSLLKPVSDLYLEFRKAQVDDELMRQFYVSRLGVPRSVPGSSVSDALIESLTVPNFLFHAEDPSCGYVPGNTYAGQCVMGMDIGQSHDAAVLYVTPKGKRVLLFAGKLSSMNDARDLCSRYNVQVAVVDQDPETTMVTDFQESVDFPVWLCRYRGDKTAYNHNELTMTANKTQMLDKLHQEMKRGKFVFPQNFRSVQNGQWLKEMTASQRELVETGSGKKEYRWEPGNQADHSHHALSYAAEAARLHDDLIISS